MILRLGLFGTLVVGLALGLGSAGVLTPTVTGTPSPNPEAAEQVVAERFAASSPERSIVDQVFLRTVRKGAPGLGQNVDANLIAAARSVCGSLDDGVPLLHLRAVFVREGYELNEVSWFFGASIGAYCPQHADKARS